LKILYKIFLFRSLLCCICTRKREEQTRELLPASHFLFTETPYSIPQILSIAASNISSGRKGRGRNGEQMGMGRRRRGGRKMRGGR
jgi:hypothetical protein